MVRAILSDVNIVGHVRVLFVRLESESWRELWGPLALPLITFPDLGLAPEAPDSLLWQVCQQQQVLLLTANRNMEGPDSLEETIRHRNTPASLPVFTIATVDRILHSRVYAERVVAKLLEYLMDLDQVRGAGRLYLP
jgi:hypothetical protein